MRILVYQWDAGQEKYIWRELIRYQKPYSNEPAHFIEGRMIELLRPGDMILPDDCAVGWKAVLAALGFALEPVEGSALNAQRLVR